nr:ABC transporter ATP-binding protein [uncultured Fusobacterium sp.]
MNLLKKYIKNNLGTLSMAIIFLILNTLSILAIPFQVSNLINNGVMKKDLSAVYSISITMIIILVLGTIAGIIANYYVAIFAAGFAKQNRQTMLRNIETLTLDQVSDLGVASLVTRVANDNSNAQQMIVAFLQMIFPSPIMAFISIFLTLELSPILTLIPLFSIGLFGFAIILTLFKSLPYILKIQKKLDRMVLVLRETFIGVKIIRAFDNSDKEKEKFNNLSSEYTNNYIIINKKFALLAPMAFALMSIVIVLILYFGSMMISNNTLEIGSITAIVEYSLTTIGTLIMSSMVLVQMPKAIVSIERIEEVLNTVSEIKDKDGLKSSCQCQSTIDDNKISLTFDNVCFRYKGAEKQILKNISFSINAGERLAIVGATGSGKSTIAKVLLRLNEIEHGKILINDVDIAELPLHCLRDNVSYIPQKAYIFSGTIADNFKFTNKDMTDKEMIEIAKVSQSYEFIDSLPDKFSSFVAQGGTNFSGGQKQRLSIARALAKKSNIYLFDDSFSALDYATDAKLRKELKTFLKDKITIIIAQRLNTIADADKIIVLKDGEITGIGTHEELLVNNNEYIELAKSQGILD